MTESLRRRDEVEPYRTLDGSEIRELLHPDHSPIQNQSLAEATLQPGQRTRKHRHVASEEIYFILEGVGHMTLGDDSFPMVRGDSLLIPPGTVHCIENTGTAPLHILCCCAPPYAHTDTELVEDGAELP